MDTNILYLARVNVIEPKEVLNIGFLSHYPFLKTMFPSFLHHHYLQFLYPTNFLVRECFSLLVVRCNDKCNILDTYVLHYDNIIHEFYLETYQLQYCTSMVAKNYC